MSTMEFVHDATAAAQPLRAELVAGPAFELLVGLSTLTRADRSTTRPGWVPELAACSPELRRQSLSSANSRRSCGCTCSGSRSSAPADIVGAVRETPADELRRHLVGVHVPAWQTLVGGRALEAAAAGDRRSSTTSGTTRAGLRALGALLPLTARADEAARARGRSSGSPRKRSTRASWRARTRRRGEAAAAAAAAPVDRRGDGRLSLRARRRRSTASCSCRMPPRGRGCCSASTGARGSSAIRFVRRKASRSRRYCSDALSRTRDGSACSGGSLPATRRSWSLPRPRAWHVRRRTTISRICARRAS